MALLSLTVELFYDGVWNAVTSDVYIRDGIKISRGRGDRANKADPSTLNLTLKNGTGRYSFRNPASPLFGKIGPNTPIRVVKGGGERFLGEISSSAPKWTEDKTTGVRGDAWVEIEAAGILRRIGQGVQPVTSSLKTFYLGTSPVTYWALTDGPGSTTGAPTSGTYKGSSIHRQFGTAVFSFGVGTLADYLPLTLRINDTDPAAGNDQLIGFCYGSSTAPNALAMDFTYKCDQEIVPGTMSATPNAFTMSLTDVDASTGISNTWDLISRHDGVNDDWQLQLTVNDPAGPINTFILADSAPLAAITDTELHHVRLKLAQNGANVDYTVSVDGATVITGTRNTQTLRRATSVRIIYGRTSNTTEALMCLGHVAVWETTANIPVLADTVLAVFGFAGEKAGRRIQRLCGEAGVVFDVGGFDLDNTQPMGLQFTDQFSAQLDEIEQTDRGLIFEPLILGSSLALSYRPRASLYGQSPIITLNYEAGHVAPPFEPVDDDQGTRNDVFAQRREGGTFNATLTSGALSVLDPPNGVGRYKDEVQVNVQTDGMLEGVAWWLLHEGTVDAARFPRVTVNMAAPVTLPALLLSVNIGDLIRIQAGPKLADHAGIYDDIDLIVLGYTETMNAVEHVLTFNCTPAAPYAIAKYGTDRFDTQGSELASGVTATATSLSVAQSTGSNTLWTTDVTTFPFDIIVAGERMTVTNISGATSPQTFTVTRSVNRVVKAQSAGASVRLFKTPRYGL